MNPYNEEDIEESFNDLEYLLSLENKKDKIEENTKTTNLCNTTTIPYKYKNKYDRYKRDPLISKYEEEWLSKQNSMGIHTKINRSHSCLNEDCQKFGNIIYLGENVFRCEKSGKVHICNMFNRCDQVIITTEGTKTCYISLYNFDQIYKEEKDSKDRVGYKKPVAKKKNKSKTCSIKKINNNSKKEIKKIISEETQKNKKTPDISTLRLTPHSVPKEWIKFENHVMKARSSTPINLNAVTGNTPEITRSTPDNFAAVVVSFKDKTHKRIAVNTFSSGKMVTKGAKDINSAIFSIMFTNHILGKSCGTKLITKDLKLKNIVSKVNIPGKFVDLQTLAKENSDFCKYNPDNFPGVIMKFPEGHTPACNIFKGGVFMLPGPNNEEYAYQCINHVYNIIEPYLYDKGDGDDVLIENKRKKVEIL